MTIEEAKQVAKANIEKEHSLGERAGGSGHLGHTSLRNVIIEDVQSLEVQGKPCWRITYRYTLVTETEFTYYPDNPPHKASYTKEIVVNGERRIVEQPSKE